MAVQCVNHVVIQNAVDRGLIRFTNMGGAECSPF